MKKNISFLMALIFSSCSIGTDFKDDEVIDVMIYPTTTQFLVGETATYSAKVKNSFQEEFEAQVTWVSDNPSVVSINQGGQLTALAKGQATISAAYNSVSSKAPVLVTVSERATEVSSVVILLPQAADTHLETGETMQLSTTVRNFLGNEIPDVAVSWASSKPEVATVDANGLIMAITDGIAKITATANGVTSNPLEIMVGKVSRSGNFTGLNGYNVEGSVTLTPQGDDLLISFGSDFSAQNGPGLYVYLSNSNNSVEGGIELGPLQSTSGPQSYTATSAALEDYNYVLVHCKPFNVPFGYAQLD